MEGLQKKSAFALAALYVLGVAVNALHLGRLGIHELDVTKLRYLVTGVLCSGFLALRIVVTALVVDFHVIRSILRDAEGAIYTVLRRWLFFAVQDALFDTDRSFRESELLTHRSLLMEMEPGERIEWIKSHPSLPAVDFPGRRRLVRAGLWLRWLRPLFGAYSAPSVAENLVLVLALLPLVLICFLIFQCLDFSHARVVLGWAPPTEAGLLIIGMQVAYMAWFFLKPAFRSTPLLDYVWKTAFALLLLLDVGLYALVVHPLVRPVFGGGTAIEATLYSKDDDAAKRFSAVTGLDLRASPKVFILHTTESAYYVTTSWSLDYSSETIEGIIQCAPIYRLRSDLLTGYRVDRPMKARR